MHFMDYKLSFCSINWLGSLAPAQKKDYKLLFESSPFFYPIGTYSWIMYGLPSSFSQYMSDLPSLEMNLQS